MKAFHFFTLSFCSLIFFISSCAKVSPPPGGIEDKNGPRVILHYPESDAVNVSRQLVATLKFSEPVNRTSIENSLTLIPDPLQRLKYKWRGQELDLIYLDSLQANRTYVITVGNQAKDLRGNALEVPYTIAFSTGSSIDRGSIKGWIGENESPQSVWLWAYRLEDDSVPNPEKTSSNYKYQGLKDGSFRIDYLPMGTYRVYAVNDLNRNGLWDMQREEIGITTRDVEVTDSSESWISFKLAIQDTTPLRVRGTKVIDGYAVDLRLSRKTQSLSGFFSNSNHDSVVMLDSYQDEKEEASRHVFPESYLSQGTWFVNSFGQDFWGKSWNDLDTITVKQKVDSTQPKILRTFPENRAFVVTPPDSTSFEFNEPIVLDTGYSLQIYYGKEDSLLARAFQKNPRTVLLIPSDVFNVGENYSLGFLGSHIHDKTGLVLADSIFDLSFQVYSADSLGIISGSLETSHGGQYLIQLNRLDNQQLVSQKTIIAPGKFKFDLLPPRKYKIEVIQDKNRDEKYAYGSAMPLQFSEPFYIFPDTIAVRPKWEQEITLKWPDNP